MEQNVFTAPSENYPHGPLFNYFVSTPTYFEMMFFSLMKKDSWISAVNLLTVEMVFLVRNAFIVPIISLVLVT